MNKSIHNEAFTCDAIPNVTELYYKTKNDSVNKKISGDDFFNKSFSRYNNKANINKASNAIIKQAMVGTYPHTTLSYPNILISNSRLPVAENAKAVINDEGKILFTWSDNSGIKSAKANDKVFLVTYFPAIKKMVYTLHAATRGDCRALLQINKRDGLVAETWISFISKDEREAGDSVYCGNVNLK
jgi:hypothetical protein